MYMLKVSTVNKASGEVIELEVGDFEQLVNAYNIAKEYEKAATALKDQLKKIIPTYLDENGKSIISSGGYQFKNYTTQRQTYNKMALYEVFDKDTVDLFIKVNKTVVDSYVKEHNSDFTQEDFEKLKDALEPDGKVSNVIRLDKVI